MKKRTILFFVGILLLAGCDVQGPPMKDPTDTPKTAGKQLPVGQGSVMVQSKPGN